MMFNLIKAQQYQMLRDNVTYYIIFVMLIIYVGIDLISAADSSTAQFSASYFAVISADGFPFLLNMLTLLYTARICGCDMTDRTMNYELLDGVKRSQVFFARFIVGVFWSAVTCAFLMIVPTAIVAAFAGWGDMMTVGGALRRAFCTLITVVRLSAMYTMLTFLLMDWKTTTVIGFIIGQTELIIVMIMQESASLGLDKKAGYFFSATAMQKFLDVSNIGIGYKNGEDIQIVKSMLTFSDGASCAAVCIGMTALYLILGFAVFRRRDIK
ncbi:ABC-type transport system involved in multi-copper enzyme maturation, permease component [Ruminococcus sp. YE71]|nr:ABC-type transport system involved in multi-copper enzyme maturation, permease component [Ruminococcus sp. YE78]SFW37138.1 ABC-type transport system involved in multi-copper enzyme maturation, permease component [Ruminococcus sp. YE71]